MDEEVVDEKVEFWSNNLLRKLDMSLLLDYKVTTYFRNSETLLMKAFLLEGDAATSE